MFEKRDRNRKKVNAFWIILSILLAAAFAGLLVKAVQDEGTERERLEKLTEKQNAGIEDYAAAVQRVADLQDENEQQEVSKAKKTDKDDKASKKSKDDNTVSDTEPGPTPAGEKAAVQGIACWGDDLINGAESSTYSYIAVLQKLLQENGYDIPVINKSLQGGGTLSMMKLAGVADEDLQNYITEHKQAAAGAALLVTETGIRDFTAEELVRDDVNCIPVIFMGYYGGWNKDVSELAEQQERILNTFADKERFLVVGTRPLDGSVGSEALDNALSAKWGEHYISLAAVTNNPSATYEAQEAMAQAVLAKLEELKYISK